MILSDHSIRARVGMAASDHPLGLLIRPFCARTVFNGMSYGLSSCGYDVRVKDEVRIPPHAMVLATTVEFFAFPADLRGALADKSSWARRGIFVQNTRFEPGWYGYPTLEISNNTAEEVVIPAGAPIGQMEFTLLDRACENPYAGKYQNQPQEPVPAKTEAA